MKTPIAFLIFKRPDTTQQVFNAIRQAQPPKLLVVADAARPDRPGEAEQCAATRAIIEQVDWDCEVLTNYAEKNLGCKDRVASGLDWVFDTVEEAIILEDDCVPHPSFFPYCEELLERYREDDRIFSIMGYNMQNGQPRGSYSYYFSRYFHCWGWASWRRAWQYYDVDMRQWQAVKETGLLHHILDDAAAVTYWTREIESVYAGRLNTWDYQGILSAWLQSGLHICPNVNLISNVGFGEAATHTSFSDSPHANTPAQPIALPLQHPPYVVRHAEADRFAQTNYYDVNRTKRAIRKLKRMLKR
ncbi:glycosyltransferase family 2 protein [Phormidium tenue FACHB-886]|nr:glycosyltransferase family 2 protein [Phormidium tenue FACHB-886]